MKPIPFVDRVDSGIQLAEKLSAYKDNPDAIVIGLPRGGVVTAAEVAKKLNLPLDIVVPRKIGAPFNEELAVGAITQDGEIVWNERIVKSLHLQPEDVAQTIEREHKEAQRRLNLYRGNRPPLNLKNKTVLLIDDGIATGATMRAAITYAKKQGAEKIIIGTPVATADTLMLLEPEVDQIVSVLIPSTFLGIGAFYESFPQTEDDEVISLLD